MFDTSRVQPEPNSQDEYIDEIKRSIKKPIKWETKARKIMSAIIWGDTKEWIDKWI